MEKKANLIAFDTPAVIHIMLLRGTNYIESIYYQ